MSTATPPSAADTAKLVVPFVKSVRTVFSTMLRSELTIGKVALKECTAPTFDVSGVIGLTGDLVGSVVVSFPQKVAAQVASAFVGSPIPEDGPDLPDAIGELTNMIVGGAKREIDMVASISVPTIVMGPGHTIARLRDVPCLVIPCSSPLGDFAVEVSVKQSANSAA